MLRLGNKLAKYEMVNVELPCYILIKIKWCDAKEKKKHHERITKYAELMCPCLRNRMHQREREREREKKRYGC